LSRITRYQKGKTNLDFTEARDSEWQWHQLNHMQICTSPQTDNHASIPPLSFLQAGCPSCRPTNSVKALKADTNQSLHTNKTIGLNNKTNTANQPGRNYTVSQENVLTLKRYSSKLQGAILMKFGRNIQNTLE